MQLKGTRRDIRTIRFSRDKAAYYSSLSIPVLVVLFHGPTGQVFAQWIQSYDPHEEPASADSIALAFRDEDLLTPASAGGLLRDMEVHRRLSSAATAFPLELTILREGDTVAGLPTASVAISLRDTARGLSDIVRIVDSQESATGSLIITSDSIAITLRGLVTSTVHYQDPWPSEPNIELVLHDVLVMLGVIANRLGRYDIAAKLLADYALGSSVIGDEAMAATVAGALTRTHRLEDAIRILEGLSGTEAFELMLFAISMTWTAESKTLSEAERDAVVDYLRRRAERTESEGDSRQAAIGYYNLANRLRVFGKQEKAIAYYRRAAELDPTYEERAYFSGDLAGSLFESGRYEEAAARYQIAVDGGGRERYLPLLGDALLHSGRYADAAQIFTRVRGETTATRTSSEWSLKSLVADRISKQVDDNQDRDEGAANALADLPAETSDAEARTRLSDALNADALCSLAWFNLAMLDLREENVTDAYTELVAAAVLSRVDLESFGLAVVIGLDLQDPHVGDVVKTAYRINGSAFIRFLTQELELPSPEEHAELLQAVELLLASGGADSTERSLEYRFVQEDGSYESMEIGLE